MALEGALRLHSQTRQRLDPLLRDIANCISLLASKDGEGVGAGRGGHQQDVRVVSASSSFFRFILSLSASASRRAIWIFCWMDSALISAMLSRQ